jgi:hypothetical protein
MKKLLLGLTAAASVTAVPAVTLLALFGVASSAIACAPVVGAGGPLSSSAPVPAAARLWVAITQSACPELPESWIAAVMAQESGFRPDAYADDSNGGTWGLFQLNASIWDQAYGAPWSADRDRNGTWDVADPEIHAATAGTYLCRRLDGVRRIRAEHSDWASTRELTELDALVVAHNAGESRLASYPAIPEVTAKFIANLRARSAAWAAPTTAAATATVVSPGCSGLGTGGSVVVPPGTPVDVATAIRTSLTYVGQRSGWRRMCDRVACRAYGFANSGYVSAAAHWNAMLAGGNAHAGYRCPPVGSFMFWTTGTPLGHAALVVENDGSCSPDRIKVVSNDVLDDSAGNNGGVYLVTLRQIESGYVRADRYLGWSEPVCAGAVLPPGTRHPAA